MEKIVSHKMWCFGCQKQFTIQTSWEDAVCTFCNCPIVEKINDESHGTELQKQEILTRTNGKHFKPIK